MSREIFYDPKKVAIVPMGFCFPGTGSSGDLPPRPECAPRWRTAVLSQLKSLELTLVVGRYALDYHLPGGGATVTEVVQNWVAQWPDLVPLPHPSPRNILWVKRNAWFEEDLLPALRARVAELVSTYEG